MVAQAVLLMFPTEVKASSAGKKEKVTVGEQALPQTVQLLSLSDNTTQFNITKKTAVWTPTDDNWSQGDGEFDLSLSQSAGDLTYVGAMAYIEFVFPQAPKTFIGSVSIEYTVYNTIDQSLQTLKVSAQVRIHCPNGDSSSVGD